MLELDEVFDLEDLLNFTVYQQEFQDEFDKIGTVLYDQMTKFISPEQLARLESIKGKIFNVLIFFKFKGVVSDY